MPTSTLLKKINKRNIYKLPKKIMLPHYVKFLSHFPYCLLRASAVFLNTQKSQVAP